MKYFLQNIRITRKKLALYEEELALDQEAMMKAELVRKMFLTSDQRTLKVQVTPTHYSNTDFGPLLYEQEHLCSVFPRHHRYQKSKIAF
jgi:hypothetical protein